MAMATLEREAGLAERKVFQIVSKALPNSTENGFAQAVWLSDQSSKAFLRRFPNATPSAEAYEAKVKLAFSDRDFELAAGFAELWVEDQPFSADAVVQLLNLRSVHIEPDRFAVELAGKAVHTFQDNWHVLNACVLVLVEAQKFDQAKLAIDRLKKATPSGPSQSFIHAAEGFLSFAMGNIAQGRQSYESAIRTGREHQKRHLVIDATMFWMRCEIDHNLMTTEYKNRLSGLIDDALKKLSQVDRDYLDAVWHSIKERVSKHENSEVAILESLGEKLVLLAKEHLEEDDLFAKRIS